MSHPILNLDQVELEPRPAESAAPGAAGERFDARMGEIASRIGARLLGCNLTAIPPGKAAFPRHNHHVNEELFVILDGAGELHIGDARHPLRAGDVVACPPGGSETAHQIRNTGTRELRFLAISTRLLPEIVGYPDSGKFGVRNEWVDPASGETCLFRYFGRSGDSLCYWDGE